MKAQIIGALKHKKWSARKFILEFLSLAISFKKGKKDFLQLCDKEFIESLKKVLSGDRDQKVKMSAAIFVASFLKNDVTKLKDKKLNKQKKAFGELMEAVQQEKAVKSRIDKAKTDFENLLKPFEQIINDSGGSGGKKKKKKKKEEAKEEKKDEPPPTKPEPVVEAKIEVKVESTSTAPTNADPNAPIGSNGKPKKKVKKKRQIKVPKKVEEKKDEESSEFKKKSGGIVEPPLVGKKLPKKFKPSKKFKEGQGYDKVLEDYSKDVACFGSYKKIGVDKICESFKSKKWIDDIGNLKSKKMEERLPQCQSLHDAVVKMKKIKADDAKSIIILISDVMGWETSNSKNPKLSLLFIPLLTHVLKNTKIDWKKDRGIFDQFITWIMDRLTDRRFGKDAKELLLATCYQFGCNVVFAKMEQELADQKKKHSKGDKNFAPIIDGIAEIVKQFGMDKIYPARACKIAYDFMKKSKKPEGKKACCQLITNLYEQGGDVWEGFVLSMATDRDKKKLNKEFFPNIAKKGEYTQFRCEINETPSLGKKAKKKDKKKEPEFDIIEEEYSEWETDHALDEPTAQAPVQPVQPVEVKEEVKVEVKEEVKEEKKDEVKEEKKDEIKEPEVPKGPTPPVPIQNSAAYETLKYFSVLGLSEDIDDIFDEEKKSMIDPVTGQMLFPGSQRWNVTGDIQNQIAFEKMEQQKLIDGISGAVGDNNIPPQQMGFGNGMMPNGMMGNGMMGNGMMGNGMMGNGMMGLQQKLEMQIQQQQMQAQQPQQPPQPLNPLIAKMMARNKPVVLGGDGKTTHITPDVEVPNTPGGAQFLKPGVDMNAIDSMPSPRDLHIMTQNKLQEQYQRQTQYNLNRNQQRQGILMDSFDDDDKVYEVTDEDLKQFEISLDSCESMIRMMISQCEGRAYGLQPYRQNPKFRGDPQLIADFELETNVLERNINNLTDFCLYQLRKYDFSLKGNRYVDEIGIPHTMNFAIADPDTRFNFISRNVRINKEGYLLYKHANSLDFKRLTPNFHYYCYYFRFLCYPCLTFKQIKFKKVFVLSLISTQNNNKIRFK